MQLDTFAWSDRGGGLEGPKKTVPCYDLSRWSKLTLNALNSIGMSAASPLSGDPPAELTSFVLIGRLLVALCCLLGGGSQSYGQMPKELLQRTFPEEFLVEAAPSEVWRALGDLVRAEPGSRVLISEASDLLFSWVECGPLPLGSPTTTRTPPAKPQSAERLRQAEVAEVGPDMVALTTVFIKATPKGSRIRFRRIYYGSRTQPLIAHSSGAYEIRLAQKIAQKLGAKAWPR